MENIQASLSGNSDQFKKDITDANALDNDADINVDTAFTGHSLGEGFKGSFENVPLFY